MSVSLITGSNGFCGRHLTVRLRGTTVGIDRQERTALGTDRYIQMNLEDADAVRDVISEVRPTHLYHLAGLATGSNRDIYAANFLSSVNVLEAVQRIVPSCRVLIVGSAAEYGVLSESQLATDESQPPRPVGAYAIAKSATTLAALNYARQYGLHVVVARPFNVVGAGIPASLLTGAILERVRTAVRTNSPIIKVGNLESQRDFISVEDVVDAYVRMLAGEFSGEVFNLCSGRAVAVREVVRILLSFSPTPLDVEIDPALCRPDEMPVSYGSFEKARRAFGFTPKMSLENALKSAWDYAVNGVALCASRS
jgi:GDP-4-dehydro-6-deoxy-D-mannose reductase